MRISVTRGENPEGVLREYDAALEIDPNWPVAYAEGKRTFGGTRARSALRLRPKDPFAGNWHHSLCHAHVHLHKYDEAVEGCRRSINLNKSYWWPFVDLISAYGATGQLELARQTLAELNAIRPGLHSAVGPSNRLRRFAQSAVSS
jgi:tetratricopeptide (TPR) repeat protein